MGLIKKMCGRKQKGTFIDYNYLVLILLFVVVFSTAMAFASEDFEGVQQYLQVQPPSNISACQVLAEDPVYDPDTDYFLRMAGGYGLDLFDESRVQRNVEERSDSIGIGDANVMSNSMFIETTVVYDDYFYQLDEIVLDATALSDTEEVSVTVSNMTEGIFGWWRTGEKIAEFSVSNTGDDIETVSEVVDDEVAGIGVAVEMERDSPEQAVYLWDLKFEGYRTDREITDPIRGFARGVGDLVQTGYNYVRCGFAQAGNLMGVVTFHSGIWWLDMIFMPFQFVLLVMIIKLVAEKINAIRG